MSRFYVGRNIAIGAAMVLSFSLARAADDLPKADTILDKYVEATGGKAAYEKHHTEIAKGTFEMAAMGVKGTMTSYHAEPNKSYTETDLGGVGKIRDGSDGTIFWTLSAMMGPHLKDGAEKAQAQLTTRFNAELNWRDLFKDVKTVGVEKVDGKDCYSVQLTPAEGSPITQCYDKESGLMVKQSMTLESPMGQQAVDSFATDYRKEGDILMPHKLKSSFGGQEVTITFDSITFNADIPPDTFAIPDEIKALVKK
jgi:outer membrane lipoprotein-sorting protein